MAQLPVLKVLRLHQAWKFNYQYPLILYKLRLQSHDKNSNANQWNALHRLEQPVRKIKFSTLRTCWGEAIKAHIKITSAPVYRLTCHQLYLGLAAATIVYQLLCALRCTRALAFPTWPPPSPRQPHRTKHTEISQTQDSHRIGTVYINTYVIHRIITFVL